ncbi:ganglioside-induced differentiation-associated protein 1 [Condylostylus longicornis]|uniref:ganglioside-induced differentiation-associated protein 1 n=1 Tax=Condylostylus longicornis TaxID=2530218 RepID=UPI00244E28F2|nr:ganglioside-induced differentiation-associated protein 1 [Condylostylus longicornis]
MDIFKKPEFTEEGLIFYFHPYNFYSQKVLFVLNEKNIPFIPYIVDLSRGEQYSDWFLDLSPTGDVPVLQDGCFVIPNSSNIINYIQVKYQTDKNCMLFQKSPTVQSEKLKVVKNLLKNLPIGALALGSFIHEDLQLNPKPPFIGPARKTCLNNNERVTSILKSSIDNENISSTVLSKKLEQQNQRRKISENREEFQKLLDCVSHTLQIIDNELGKDIENQFLCGSYLTIDDINLGLFLYRLYTLGYENYFWGNGKLPYIEKYLKSFRNSKSFEKSVPTNIDILKEVWSKTPANYKIGAGVLGVAMFAAGALIHK